MRDPAAPPTAFQTPLGAPQGPPPRAAAGGRLRLGCNHLAGSCRRVHRGLAGGGAARGEWATSAVLQRQGDQVQALRHACCSSESSLLGGLAGGCLLQSTACCMLIRSCSHTQPLISHAAPAFTRSHATPLCCTGARRSGGRRHARRTDRRRRRARLHREQGARAGSFSR